MFAKFLKTTQKLLISTLTYFFGVSFFVSSFTVMAAPISFGSAFNLKHVTSSKYLGYQNLNDVGSSLRYRNLNLMPLDAKNLKSRWYIINPVATADPNQPNNQLYKIFEGTLATGSSVILRSVDTDFNLNQNPAIATKILVAGNPLAVNMSNISPEHQFVIKMINDNTFCLTVGTDKIVGMNAANTKFELVTNAAAASNPASATQYHFIAEDEANFGAAQATNLNIGNNLTTKGFTQIGQSQNFAANIQSLVNDQIVTNVVFAKNPQGVTNYFAIRASDNSVVFLNSNKVWVRTDNITDLLLAPGNYLARTYAFAEFLSISNNSLMALDRGALTGSDWSNPTPFKHFSMAWSNPAPFPQWKTTIQQLYKLNVTEDGLLTILDTTVFNDTKQMILNKGTDKNAVMTDFSVIDAAAGNDGTIWCVSAEGSVHKIDAGTFSYAASNPATRDLIPANPLNPTINKIKAIGNATDSIVGVLNSAGELFVSINNGPFKNFGVTGIIDFSISADGSMVIVAPAGLSKFGGFVWVGNYFTGTNDLENAKYAAALEASVRTGAYNDYLDISIQIKQATRFLTLSADKTGLSSIAAAEPNTSASFKFTPVGTNSYQIKYDNRFLAVNKNGSDYILSLKATLGATDESIFHVYGSNTNAQVRVRHKDRFLAIASTGNIVLSPTETMLSFVATSTFLAAQNQILLDTLNREKLRLQEDIRRAVEAIQAALQPQIEAAAREVIDARKAVLDEQIKSKQSQIDALNATLQTALTEKNRLMAQINEAENARIAHQLEVTTKTAELTAQLNSTTDPARKAELQRQIQMLAATKEDMANILIANSKQIVEQEQTISDLTAANAKMLQEINYIENNSQAKADAMQAVFSGDINNLLQKMVETTRNKLITAFGLTEVQFNTKFPSSAVVNLANLAAIATATGKTEAELTTTITREYINGTDVTDMAKAITKINQDFASLKKLPTLDKQTILNAFKEDLTRFATAINKNLKEVIEKMSDGFNTIKTAFALTDASLNEKINSSFTATPQNLGSAWALNRNLVARIINYDLLEKQYQDQLVLDRAALQAVKDKMIPAINNNERLRGELRKYMDDRAIEQKVIDDGIIGARREMVAATTAEQMQNIVAKVEALKSTNEKIKAQILENTAKIMQNNATIEITSTAVTNIQAKLAEITANQQTLLVSAAQSTTAAKADITTELAIYNGGDAAFQTAIARIDAMNTATTEGAANQFRERSNAQVTYFNAKKSSQEKLRNLTKSLITQLETTKGVYDEINKILDGEKRQLTQNFNKKVADLALSNPPATQAMIDAANATYNESVAPINKQIQDNLTIIKDKDLQIRAALQADMDRMQNLSSLIRESNAKQAESLRYQMIGQETAARELLQDALAGLEKDNEETIIAIKAAYAEAQAELKRISERTTEENNRRKTELDGELTATKALYESQKAEIEADIAKMIAEGTIAKEQKIKFDTWKAIINSSLQGLNNKINLTSANYKQLLERQPVGFDANISSIFESLQVAMPTFSELLNILGVETTLSVREEILRQNMVKSLSTKFSQMMPNISKTCVIGVTSGGAAQTQGYLTFDENLPAIRQTITIAKHVKFNLVKRSNTTVSVERFNDAKALTVGTNNVLSFTPINATPATNQLFTIEFGTTEGTFKLKQGNQYLNVSGNITVTSLLNGAVLALNSTGSNLIAFEPPMENFEADFTQLETELPNKLNAMRQAFDPSNPNNPFSTQIQRFKSMLDQGFVKLDALKYDFVGLLKETYDDNEIADMSAAYQESKNTLSTALATGLLDAADKPLATALTADTTLDAATREGVTSLIAEALRQAGIQSRIIDEQNYRLTELRKIYLQTMVEKNIEIAYLEIDSRWQKFQWARDMYMLIQTKLSMAERDRLNFEAELARAAKTYADRNSSLDAERQRAIQVLKDTLQQKIAAAIRAQEEIKKLTEEAKKIFDEQMVAMQARFANASAEEKVAAEKVMARKRAEQDLLVQQTASKFAAEKKELELAQERLDSVNSAQVKTINLQIMNAKQYLLNLKIDNNSQVALSFTSSNNGELAYLTQSPLDDLQITPGIRFNNNTRFKIVKQDDESFAIETMDGTKRITLLSNRADVDLMPAKNVASKDRADLMVAANDQKFFIEGTQAEGAVIRDLEKIGYITVKEMTKDNQKINALAFTTASAAVSNAATGKENSSIKETLFKIVNFTPGSGTVNEMLETYFSKNSPNDTQAAVDAAQKFFNDNKLFNYPDLMDNFVQAISEFGQGRVSKGLMKEETLKAINKMLFDITQTFMFTSQDGNGQIVTSGGAINLLDKDFVEPIFLEDGQSIAIELDGKFLSTNGSVSPSGNPTVAFEDGAIFNKNLNCKVVGTATRNVFSLTDMRGTKRLSNTGTSISWIDINQNAGENELFTANGTKDKAMLMVNSKAVVDKNLVMEGGELKRVGAPWLETSSSANNAVNFKVHVFKPGSFESLLVSQGLEKYSNNAESKKAIDNITNKLIELLENPDFDEESKNYFLQTFGNYLTLFVDSESISLWGTAVKKVMFTANKRLKNIDQAIAGRITNTVKEFSIPSGVYLVLKNVQENKYLATSAEGKAIAKDNTSTDKSMLFKVVREGDKYALISNDGSGGYLTAANNEIAVIGSPTSTPAVNQLFWLLGFGNQLMIKLGSTLVQDETGYLAVNSDLVLTARNAAENSMYSATNARTKFEAQILDDHSIMRADINRQYAAVPTKLLEGLMAVRENKALTDAQKSLAAQQKLQEFEEFVLLKEIIPAAKEGDAPTIMYNLKPQYEALREQKTNAATNLYSLKNTLEYIEQYVFYDATAKAGIKQGTIGDTIFKAMKEAFSEFRILNKRFDDIGLQPIINPGALPMPAGKDFRTDTTDYIGQYLDQVLGNENSLVKGAQILYGYILKLAKVVYGTKYTDNSNRFKFNQLGQIIDRNGAVYNLNSNGIYVDDKGVSFTELAAPVLDPDEKVLAAAAEFQPGIGFEVSRSNFSLKINVAPTGNAAELERLREQILKSDSLDEVKQEAMLYVVDQLRAGANQQIDFTPVKRIIEGAQESIYFNFKGKNGKRMVGGDKQLTAEAKEKIAYALDKFIDGKSNILNAVVNARDMLSDIQAEAVLPAFSEMKNLLDRNFKLSSNFKEEDMQRMIRKIHSRSDYENNQWRREMLVKLFEFVGATATFEQQNNGPWNLAVKEKTMAQIYDKQDMLSLIEKLKRQIFTVTLRDNQISIGEYYDKLLEKAINDYMAVIPFAGNPPKNNASKLPSYREILDTLNLFKDDQKPKDWSNTDVDASRKWFVGVQPLPGDGTEAVQERNEYERDVAWDDNNKKYFIRLLTFEQQTLRMNLMETINADLKKTPRTSSTVAPMRLIAPAGGGRR